MASLTEFIHDARRKVDEGLDRWLPKPPACPPIVSDAVRYSLFAGGKRLRPVLVLAAAETIAADALDRALPAACALEFIHTYSLIHDDLPAMDNDTLRRGRPTLHVVYGDGIAILAGDALQAEAFALLSREPAIADAEIVARKLRAVRIVAEAAGAVGMVGGQAIDLQAAGQAPGHAVTLDGEGLRAMHARKTGALIRAAATAGAVMAGADDTATNAIDAWATEVGLAFQIVDDILDVEGSAGELGKTAGKDAAHAKPTYPALFGLDRSRALAAECARRAHDILAAAQLTDGRLDAIADWIVARRH
ncbi:MAG TPA: farnesyl diphosphate synthase [Vicinamibacterales bacterium]|nr:farnesyl diphosphate synthase [Vicinamibacterales bacterium]